MNVMNKGTFPVKDQQASFYLMGGSAIHGDAFILDVVGFPSTSRETHLTIFQLYILPSQPCYKYF